MDQNPQSPAVLRGEGVLSTDDLRAALRLRGGRGAAVGSFLFLAAVAALTPAICRAGRLPWPTCLWAAVPPGGLLAGIALYAWTSHVHLRRRQLRRFEAERQPEVVEVNGDGVTWTQPQKVVEVRWVAFTGYRADDRLLVLVTGSSGAVAVIPRTYFAQAPDWETLLRRVQERLPRG